jgi:hypothetical protein
MYYVIFTNFNIQFKQFEYVTLCHITINNQEFYLTLNEIMLTKEPEQTEAIPLVVHAPKKKRTKVTDTRLSPRAARALLHESLQQHASEHHHLDMIPRLCSPATPPSHQHHHHHHFRHESQQQQLSFDSLSANVSLTLSAIESFISQLIYP